MSKPEPANKNLYEKVKKEAKSKFEHWPSAYGSQWLVKTYKERGGTYTGGQKKETSGVLGMKHFWVICWVYPDFQNSGFLDFRK